MYAVFVRSRIDPSRADEAEALLKNRMAPMIKEAPGFISGTWARAQDRSEGRSMVLFTSEKDAKSTLEAIQKGIPSDGPVEIVDTAVSEVLHQI